MKWALLLVAAGCGACAQEDVPQADPAAVERLLVRLDAQQSGAAERLLPAKTTEKLNRAERMVAPLEKVQADKIDPNVAIAFIAG